MENQQSENISSDELKIDYENFELINCNLCGSKDFKVIYKEIADEKGSPQEKYKSSGNIIASDQIVKCKSCGLLYVNPRLKPEIIVQGYSEGSDETFVSQSKGRELTFKKSLKFIEKYANNKGKILDIGTAGGSFLKVAKEKGWSVYGVEPNKWLCNWAKENYGIDVLSGTIFDHKFEDEFFDVITLWDVLEHVPDPAKVLDECRRILRPGGILVVNYPDIGTWIAKFMKKKWVFLLSVHLFYFNKKTIRLMLNKKNFNVIKTKPHFQTLGLDYLIFRAKAYNKMIAKVGGKVSKTLRIGNMQLPYWLGQTLVIAKKE